MFRHFVLCLFQILLLAFFLLVFSFTSRCFSFFFADDEPAPPSDLRLFFSLSFLFCNSKAIFALYSRINLPISQTIALFLSTQPSYINVVERTSASISRLWKLHNACQTKDVLIDGFSCKILVFKSSYEPLRNNV